LFDAPGTNYPGGIAIEQQRQHHPGGILFTARAPFIDPDLAQVQFLDHLQDEVSYVIGWHPIPQIGR